MASSVTRVTQKTGQSSTKDLVITLVLSYAAMALTLAELDEHPKKPAELDPMLMGLTADVFALLGMYAYVENSSRSITRWSRAVSLVTGAMTMQCKFGFLTQYFKGLNRTVLMTNLGLNIGNFCGQMAEILPKIFPCLTPKSRGDLYD